MIKILDIHRSFTTFYYNKFEGEILIPKITEKELVDKSNIYGFIDKSNFLDKGIVILTTKLELKAEKVKIVQFKGLASSFCHSKSCFELMELKTI